MKLIIITLLTFLISCSELVSDEWVTESIGNSNFSVSIPKELETQQTKRELDLKVIDNRFYAFKKDESISINIGITQYPIEHGLVSEKIELNCNSFDKSPFNFTMETQSLIVVAGEKTKIIKCSSDSLAVHIVSFFKNNAHFTMAVGAKSDSKDFNFNKVFSGVTYNDQ